MKMHPNASNLCFGCNLLRKANSPEKQIKGSTPYQLKQTINDESNVVVITRTSLPFTATLLFREKDRALICTFSVCQ